MVPSPLPLTIVLPSWEKTSDHTYDLCPSRLELWPDSCKFQTRIGPIVLPPSIALESGEKATEAKLRVSAESVCSIRPVSGSQILIVLSALALANDLPVDEKATDQTVSV